MSTPSHNNKTWADPDPFPMPALSGGLFAITREWWERSGTYDTEMLEWGGENVEMSLRIWRCGGKLVALPCSRVGHMFRRGRPYSFHGEATAKNNKRVAAVWLDNHIANAVKANDDMFSDLSGVGDIVECFAF